MITPCGTFTYSVVVGRDKSAPQRWIGKARSLRDPSTHPGKAGKRPWFELGDGHIVLRATESRLTRWLNPDFRRWPPCHYCSFEVGNTPAAVMEAGDQIAFNRHGTGDYALTIIRNESLVLGIGAITSLPLGREIQVEEDARLRELQINCFMRVPRERPNDLHITFTTGGERINLCEGEEGNIGSYYARVERVYRTGIPGELSILALGQLSRTLTKDMVLESVAFIRRC